jgi:hypothetical protein
MHDSRTKNCKTQIGRHFACKEIEKMYSNMFQRFLQLIFSGEGGSLQSAKGDKYKMF